MFVTSLKDRLPRWDRLLYTVARLHRLGLRSAERAAGGDQPGRGTRGGLGPTARSRACRRTARRTSCRPAGRPGGPRRSCSRTATCSRTPGRSRTGPAARFGEDVSLACLPFFHSYGLTVCGLTGRRDGRDPDPAPPVPGGHGPAAGRAVEADADPGRPGDAGRVQQGAPAEALRPELGPGVHLRRRAADPGGRGRVLRSAPARSSSRATGFPRPARSRTPARSTGPRARARSGCRCRTPTR